MFSESAIEARFTTLCLKYFSPTEFANFENESGDGGIGKIKAYSTYDFNVDYDFNFHGVRCTLFGAAKNLGDQIFVASRLNRGQSGLMPGGFRQINGGINILL